MIGWLREEKEENGREQEAGPIGRTRFKVARQDKEGKDGQDGYGDKQCM